MKQLLLTIAALLAMSVPSWADGYRRLTVDLSDGSKVVIGLTDDVSLAFDGEWLVAAGTPAEVKVPRAEIVSLSHGTEAVSAVRPVIDTQAAVTRRGDILSFSNLQDNATVAVYDLGGVCVMSLQAAAGALDLDLSGLAPGAYAVKAGATTLKITVR